MKKYQRICTLSTLWMALWVLPATVSGFDTCDDLLGPDCTCHVNAVSGGLGASVSVAGDGWKTKADDDLSQGNNFGHRLGLVASYSTCRGALDLGIFSGASIGLYDYHGRPSAGHGAEDEAEAQVFASIGAYNRCNSEQGFPFSFGLSVDYMHDNLFGEGESQRNHIDVFQLRLLLGLAVSSCDEIGAWGSFNLNKDQFWSGNQNRDIQVSALPQGRLFWLRRWDAGAETVLSGGWAEAPAEFVIEFRTQVELSPVTSIFAGWTYCLPSTSAGDVLPNNVARSFTEEYWNISAGISVNLGGAESRPALLDLADNGLFVVKAPTGNL